MELFGVRWCLLALCMRLLQGKVVYEQPRAQVDLPQRVFANPDPWPVAATRTSTCSVFWQRGYPNATVVTPTLGWGAAGNMSAYTGLGELSAAQQARTQVLIPHAVQMTTDDDAVSLSGVQFASDGAWGAVLNTTPTQEHLTTTTIEAGFDDCYPVW